MYFGDTLLSTGTGFLVQYNGGFALITNRHNVTGRDQTTKQPISAHGGIPDRVTVWQNSQNGLGHWHQEQYDLLDSNGEPLWKEHPTLGPLADFVALPLRLNSLAKPYPYDVMHEGHNMVISPGEIVSVVGFPFGLSAAGGRFAIWATGFMATEHDLNYDQRPVFLIDCRSRPGQSGSPVIANRSGGMIPLRDGSLAGITGPISQFLGIYSGRINDQSDLGIVWKRSAIAELVQSL